MGPGNKFRDDSLCVVRAGLSYSRCVNVVVTRPGMTLLCVARASYPGLPFNPLLHLLHRRARLAGAVAEAGPALADSVVASACMAACSGERAQAGSTVPASPVSAKAWQRQPPQSISRRSQERQGSGIQSVPR